MKYWETIKPVECVWVCYRGVALQIGLLDKKQRMCETLLERSHVIRVF